MDGERAALEVRGLINVQFAIQDNTVSVIEVNPRASRTVPFLARSSGRPWAELAARVCAGASIDQLGVHDGVPSEIAVKLPVFPFERFPELTVNRTPTYAEGEPSSRLGSPPSYVAARPVRARRLRRGPP